MIPFFAEWGYLEKDCVVRLGISVELREVGGGLHRVDELGWDGGGGVAGGGRRGGHCVAGGAPDVGSCKTGLHGITFDTCSRKYIHIRVRELTTDRKIE